MQDSPTRRTLRTLACGLAMGVSDAIPGVSGGTIALILGIYEKLIGSLGEFVAVLRSPFDSETQSGAVRALRFLVPLGIGVIAAYFVATKLLVGDVPSPSDGDPLEILAQLETTPPEGWLVNAATAPVVFAFFFGLVLMSVNEPWRTKTTFKPVDIVLALLGVAAAAALGLSPPAGGSTNPAALVGAGAVAISVMLLPGVSGSLALLVLGMYQPVSGAIHSREWGVMMWFGIGLALGVIAFVPLLRRLLATAHDRTMSVLSGLMFGSLVALWPWKAHYLPKFIPHKGAMSPEAPFGDWWLAVASAVAGGAVIVITARLARANQGAAQH